MRSITIENSTLFAGVTDGITTLTNMSGESEGMQGDNIKTGGTRIDLDLLCGLENQRCLTKYDGNGNKVLDLMEGKVQWNREGANGQSLSEWLETPEGKNMAGATGGVQGWKGMLFGIPYAPGSWQDKLIESFGGTHDYIGGQLSGLYDEQGNARRGRSTTEKTLHEVWSGLAIAPSAPFAMAELLPPEIWKGIGILLDSAQ
jgi:filamentous hemagglutinin